MQKIAYPKEQTHRIAYTKQGEGFIKRSERRALVSSFVKRDGIWQFVNAEFQA